jgi:hypothetical protein
MILAEIKYTGGRTKIYDIFHYDECSLFFQFDDGFVQYGYEHGRTCELIAPDDFEGDFVTLILHESNEVHRNVHESLAVLRTTVGEYHFLIRTHGSPTTIGRHTNNLPVDAESIL